MTPKIKYQNLKQDYFEFNAFLAKNLRLLFASVYKNLRTYIYVYIVPIIFMLGVYMYQSFGGANKLLPPLIMGLLLIPGFGIAILLNTLISEWKASIFLKRIHVIGTSKSQFLLAIWIVGYVIGLSAILFGAIIMVTINAIYSPSGTNDFLEAFSFLSYGTFGQAFLAWAGFFLGASIVVLSSIGVATLIAGSLKSISLTQSLVILFLFFAVIFSDLFLSPSTMAGSKVTVVMSYFVPQKYGAWTTFYATSDGNINYFLSKPVSALITVSFNNIYGPIFGGLGYCTGLFVASLFLLNWNNRG
ncbi:hypothetical protein [Spiroplasma sp. SV19]|uniref:hypothetical protein n=1 Tax=Spiroplasma sp. SV19 TaxID=2570468 RepID=UPI0024B7AB88|nr:hypothetical protein [Spiroplasma sp. SV19]WHQ36676.1 hypothetical protein E7Y35_02000 [Spiroplasma sp. SV19]